MLGDLFGTRGNYETGLLYSSRRRFLNNSSCLEPPLDFKTRRQAIRTTLQKNDPQMNIYATNACVSTGPTGLEKDKKQPDKKSSVHGEAGTRFKKTAQVIVDAVILDQELTDGANTRYLRRNGAKDLESDSSREMPSNITYGDWKQETACGVRVWVNKRTGEVTKESPYAASPTRVITFKTVSSAGKASVVRVPMSPPQNTSAKPRPDLGTGCLVYDGSEIDELFHMLGSPASSGKPAK